MRLPRGNQCQRRLSHSQKQIAPERNGCIFGLVSDEEGMMEVISHSWVSGRQRSVAWVRGRPFALVKSESSSRNSTRRSSSAVTRASENPCSATVASQFPFHPCHTIPKAQSKSHNDVHFGSESLGQSGADSDNVRRPIKCQPVGARNSVSHCREACPASISARGRTHREREMRDEKRHG